jgi:hypothetical protein
MSSVIGLRMCGNFFLERRGNRLGVVEAERGLRQVGDAVVSRDVQLLDLAHALDHVRAVRRFAERADDLVVVAVADQDDREFLPRVADGFGVDLGDQRAGGVDLDEVSRAGLSADLGRNAVRAEDERRAAGNLVDGFHECHAALDEAIDDVAIVDDLVEDIDRRSLQAQDPVDAIDRHVDARTEPAAGLPEQHFHLAECHPSLSQRRARAVSLAVPCSSRVHG